MAHLVHELVFPLGGDPSTASAKLIKVNLWAKDTLELIFSNPIKVDAAASSVASYKVYRTIEDGVVNGVAVTVTAVRPGTSVTTAKIYLNITQPSHGAAYAVSIVGTLVTADNVTIGTDLAYFRGHRTKIDIRTSVGSPIYDYRPGAYMREILNALGRSDHLIGGHILSVDKALFVAPVDSGTGSVVPPPPPDSPAANQGFTSGFTFPLTG